MLHFLTAGHIDEEAAQKCRLVVHRTLDEAILLALIERYRDSGSFEEIAFERQHIVLTHGCVRCPWYTPRINLTSIAFVLDLQAATRCVIADVEHGKIVHLSELKGLLSGP